MTFDRNNSLRQQQQVVNGSVKGASVIEEFLQCLYVFWLRVRGLSTMLLRYLIVLWLVDVFRLVVVSFP